jgi:hypothetical protein
MIEQGSKEDDDVECCWICLDHKIDEDVNPLYSPCKCPRLAHKFCIAKWQLTSGKTHCAFCDKRYDHWKQLTSPNVLQSYYDVPTSIRFAFQIQSKQYIIPIQTFPCINVRVVLDTFNMLSGANFDNVKCMSCRVRDPFTKDIITVVGRDGVESTVHFVLIGKAYSRYLHHKRNSFQKVSVSVRYIAGVIHSKVNRLIVGSTRKNQSI